MMPLYIKSHCVKTPNEYHSLVDRLTHATIFKADTIEELEGFISSTIAPMTEREYWEHILFDLRIDPASLKVGARKTEWFKEREDDYLKAWKRHTERLENKHLNPTVGRKIPHSLIESILKDLHEKEEREYQKMLASEKKRRGLEQAPVKMVASEKKIVKKENPVKPKVPVKKKKSGDFKPKTVEGKVKRENPYKPKKPTFTFGVFD